jgi:hypothetical protein
MINMKEEWEGVVNNGLRIDLSCYAWTGVKRRANLIYLKNNSLFVIASLDDVCRDEAIWILKRDCFVVP